MYASNGGYAKYSPISLVGPHGQPHRFPTLSMESQKSYTSTTINILLWIMSPTQLFWPLLRDNLSIKYAPSRKKPTNDILPFFKHKMKAYFFLTAYSIIAYSGSLITIWNMSPNSNNSK